MKKMLSIALVLFILLGMSVPVNATTEADNIYVASVNVENRAEGIYVHWAVNKSGADSFNIYRRAAGEPEPTLIASNVTSYNYLDENVEHNTYYMYFASAVIDGVEGYIMSGNLTKFVSSPENVKISVVNDNFKVEWDAVPGAYQYRVFYSPKGKYEWYMGATVAGTSCTVTPRIDCSSFDIIVVAFLTNYYHSGLNRPYSITRVITPQINAIENCPGGIYIRWYAVSPTCKYRVYRRGAGEKYWTYLETVDKVCQNMMPACSEYYDYTVKSGVYYTYTVVGEEDGCRSAVSTTNPLIKHVATPKLQAVANGTDGSYIRWAPVEGATKYVIYRREAGNLSWTAIGSVKPSEIRFKDTNTVWGQYYRYTVVAESGNYKSGFDKNGLVIRFFPLGGTWKPSVIFNFYKGAVTTAKDYYKNTPAYVAKTWQDASGVTFTGSNRAFVSEFQKEFRNSFYKSSNPYTVRPSKGSSEAAEYLPYCYANISQVKSATVTKKGRNYCVKLVFKDLGTPTDKSYGVAGISPMYYDLKEDVRELYRQGYVSSYTASTVYKNYTITAEITPDNKLVNMTHTAPGYVSGSMNFGGDIGTVKCSGKVICYANYSNFKY